MLGHGGVNQRGRWLGSVFACGAGALLSHRSAAALWGLIASRGAVEVTSAAGRGRPGIVVHEGGIDPADRSLVDSIPVTSVARTLLDLPEVVDEQTLRRAFEEADRLRLLELRVWDELCSRSSGRRGLRALRPLIAAAREPTTTASPLEDRFAAFCEEHRLPPPATNVLVLGHEVDAFWPKRRLVVEADSYAYHRHRAAFERDRARDAEFAAAGYTVIRLTHRRLEEAPGAVADQLRRLLGLGGERGQATVEWVALLLLSRACVPQPARRRGSIPGALGRSGRGIADPLRGGDRRLAAGTKASPDRRLRERGRRARPEAHADRSASSMARGRCRSTSAAAGTRAAATGPTAAWSTAPTTAGR